MELPTIEEFTKEVVKKAMDEYVYKGKTLKEWIEKIKEYEQEENDE